MQRLQDRYRTPNGDLWEEWLVIYNSDRYAEGGYDEVLQYKKNGYEVEHITYHRDKYGNLLQEHKHGSPYIPDDAERI